MTIFEGEQQLCPCYEEDQEFQKLAELKDSGLVIYCHRKCTEDIRQNEAVESKDAFIFYNKKDVKITNSELRSELDKKNISCPRCRKTLDHVRELIQEVKSIERKIVMGICDHCRKKAQTDKKQFCTCDDIVSKFKYIKGEQKEDTKKYVKIWLSKMGTLVKDGKTVNKPKQMKYRAHSDLQINREYTPRQDPKLQKMFYSETHKSDINLNIQIKETGLKEYDLKPSVAFSQHTKPVAISFARKSCESEKSNIMIPRTSLLDSDTTSMKTCTGFKELPRTSLKEEKQGEEIFIDTPSMDAKEELKRRHDLSLRQMMRLERDSAVLVSVSKIPHVYEIPKIAPWEQKEPTSEAHVESETNMKTSIKTKFEIGSRRPRDLDFSSKQLVKYETSRTLQKNLRDSYSEQKKADKYYHIDNKKKLDKSEEKNIKEQRRFDKFSPKAKKLDTKVAKLKTWYKKVSEPKETGIKQHFSFYFPKVEKKENQVQIFVSSTHLIIDTQEKFLLQAEKKRREDYQQKFERDQRKISQEEIKVQAKEKTRQYVDDQKTYEEEQDRLTKYKKYSKNEKGKSELKDKGDDEVIESRKKDLKEKSKQKSKDYLESEHISTEKGSKDLRTKYEYDQQNTGLEIEQKIQIKEETQDAKHGRAIKEKKQQLLKMIDSSSRNGKFEQMKWHSPDEIKASQSTILKKTDKKKETVSANENDIVDIRQKKEINIKKEREELDEKLHKNEEKERLKLMEQMWEEKKLLKKAAEKKQQSKGKEAPFKKLNSNQIKQDTSDVMISQIVKKVDKEISENKMYNVEIKQKKEIQIKKVKEELDEQLHKNEEKERLKLMEQMWKEKKLLKKAAEKEQHSKDKEVPSKTLKSYKIEQDTPDDMISPSVILKNINKDKKEMTANKETNIEIKKEVTGKEQENIKEKKESKDITSKDVSEWKKLQAEYLKEKALETKKQLKHKAQGAKEKESTKEQAELKAKLVELRMSNIKIEDTRKHLVLELAQVKQADSTKPCDFETAKSNGNKCDHGINKRLFCPLCYNPELQLEVICLDNKMNEPTELPKHIVIGEKIYKIKPCFEETKGPPAINFWQKFSFDPPEEITPQEEPAQKKTEKLLKKNIEAEPGKGILRYALSDRTFIEKGWTVLPTEKVVRKMNVYRMRPAHPEFDWFEHNKSKRLMTYDTGEKLAQFDDNGRGRWYYRSGRLALDYYDAEETNAQQRFVIYSSGERDERGRTHPITILATFDYLGNGIVFDHAGKIRLKYNQTEGVVLDRSIGPVSHWKWHTLNDPPVLQQVMIDTQLPQKDPAILKLGTHSDQRRTQRDNEEMLAIEFDNFIKEKSKKLSQKFKPFQIKMKALKINEHFSLKVLDQATVYLIFRDGTTNLKLNIGMILDHKEIVDTETAEVGEVSNSLEQFPARTNSLAGLQRSVAHAQRYERQHTERERRLRRPEACASADQLTAAASPPLRLPFRTVPSGPSSSTGYCCNRKPTNSLYYNTRLV